MAYIYLFNLYDELDRRQEVIRREQQAFEPQTDGYHYHAGRLEILRQFRQYLGDQMTDKLPKRLRKKLKQKKRPE